MNENQKTKSRFTKFLTNPKAAILGIIIGILIGLYIPSWVAYIAPFGNSYVSLLALCTFPIIISSIILGLAKTIKNRATSKRLFFLVAAFLCGMALTFTVGVTAGFIGGKNIISYQGSRNMAAKIVAVENYTKQPSITNHGQLKAEVKPHHQNKLNFILKQITPRNVFAALHEGMTLKVIFITLLLGIALGKSTSTKSEILLEFISSANQVFKRIFHWVLYLLPFGLACIFANNAASFTASNFSSLIEVTALICIAGLVLVIIYNLIICWNLKIPFFEPFRALRKPMILAFFTMSSSVAIPYSIEALKKLNINANIVDLVTPLGLSINRQGNVLVLVVVAIVTAIFYQIHLSFSMLLILFLSAGFMGAATFGGGVILIPAFITICKLVGMPATAGIALITITDLFVFWIRLLVSLQANYALTALVGNPNHS